MLRQEIPYCEFGKLSDLPIIFPGNHIIRSHSLFCNQTLKMNFPTEMQFSSSSTLSRAQKVPSSLKDEFTCVCLIRGCWR